MVFNIKYEKLKFTTTLFGLTNDLAIFYFMMNNIFQLYLDKFAIVYFKNIVIYSKTKKKYLEYIKKNFKALANYWLYAKPSDCIIIVKNLEFYKYVVRNSTMKPVISKVKIIDEWLILKIIHEI